MKKWVSTLEKREFLHWFLQHYRLKHPESRRLLEIILNHPHILENVSFTERLNDDIKTIVISSLYSDEQPFAFFDHGQVVTDVANAVSSITLNPSDRFALLLHFHGKMLNHRYLQLVETQASENITLHKHHQEQVKEADKIMNQVLAKRRIEQLRAEIDRALDEKNATLFKELTDELQKLHAK